MPVPAWVDTSLFVPFTRVLWQILLQTADSLQHPQFELRRVGMMVLPLLSEVMWWYDPNGLERVWRVSLTAVPPTPGLSLVALQTMRQSLAHLCWLNHQKSFHNLLNTVIVLTQRMNAIIMTSIPNLLGYDQSKKKNSIFFSLKKSCGPADIFFFFFCVWAFISCHCKNSR